MIPELSNVRKLTQLDAASMWGIGLERSSDFLPIGSVSRNSSPSAKAGAGHALVMTPVHWGSREAARPSLGIGMAEPFLQADGVVWREIRSVM